MTEPEFSQILSTSFEPNPARQQLGEVLKTLDTVLNTLFVLTLIPIVVVIWVAAARYVF